MTISSCVVTALPRGVPTRKSKGGKREAKDERKS